ncbi:hypothetical protein DRO69_06190 [Candidatus Bathyarchaeota archaeon]|nr:MAG: hypothetical protein DRO69_06190 [Candidatus Bathyarchaeota archaeon]
MYMAILCKHKFYKQRWWILTEILEDKTMTERMPLIQTKTSISYKTEEKTIIRGYDLSELAEKGYTFCDVLFILFQGRIPTEVESRALSLEMGAFLEHSMSPSAAAAIAVATGRPDLPAAIAAGISTFGAVHGPGANHGLMLNTYLKRALEEGKSIDEIAKILVDEYLSSGRRIPGFGQPQHIDGDPRAEPLHILHEALGLAGVYYELQRAIEKYFKERREKEGKKPVPVNVVGSGNTLLSDLGFSPLAAWCLGSICRGYSCAAHAIHHYKKGHAWAASRREPMVQMLDLSMIKYVGPADREVPSPEERQEYAKKQKEEGEYKKWVL